MVKRILITGGNGFVGKNLVPRLRDVYWNDNIIFPTSAELNLLNKDEVYNFFSSFKPHLVIHLAAKVGGIGANAASPGTFIYDNLTMGINIIEASRLSNVEHFIMTGTVCSYPKFTPVPFQEYSLWDGYPEETNAPYGIAKKTLMEMLRAYAKQYGLNNTTLIPSNMYGPCFSKDTIVLTPKGKINIKDIKVGDEVYTLNPKTKNIEISNVIATQINKTNEWYIFQNKTIDFQVTPDHKICHLTHYAKNIIKKRADYFEKHIGKKNGQITLPHHNPYQTNITIETISLMDYIDNNHILNKEKTMVKDFKHSRSKYIPLFYNSLDFAELLGWLISEGCHCQTQKSKNNIQTGQTTISQSKEKNINNYNSIECLLKKMNIPFGKDNYRFFFTSRLFNNFIAKEIGIYAINKKIPNFVFENTSLEFKQRLFDSLMKGDGNKNNSKYTTKSIILKDQIHHLAFLLGKKVSKTKLEQPNNMWRIYFRTKKPRVTLKYKNISRYNTKDETCYCITTDKNNIIYAGRNDKLNWVGQCDSTNLATNHVIPALMQKIVKAKKENTDLVVWGTGQPSREFLYVDDFVDAVILSIEKGPLNTYMNIGTGVEIKIIDLVEKLANLMDFRGTIFFDKSKPDGQPRRCVSTTLAKELLGFTAKTSLDEGLKLIYDA